jgi:uncharacterized protein YlzI (FlbEa/FlbD family)
MKTIVVTDTVGNLHLLAVSSIEVIAQYADKANITMCSGYWLSTKETILELSHKIAEAERNEIIA